MAITLYHVSYNLEEPLQKEFVPRIPGNSVNEENQTTPRVCLSDSIQGCIRAINGYPRTDSGYVDIIVWKHEFDETKDLYNWEYLYSNYLVPDAAVTHEHWYTKKIVMDGAIYRVSDIEYKTLYSFHPKYKKDIIQILSEYTDDLNIFENMDPCTIINEWVPKHLTAFEDEIIEKMKEVVVCEEQSDETEEQDSQYANVFAKIFGEEPKEKNMVGDYDPTDMLVGCKLRTRR